MIVIQATQEAVTTDKLYFNQSQLPITFVGTGFSPNEEITFEVSPDGGVTWTPLRIYGDVASLSYENNIKVLYAPVVLRLVKSLTLNPVQVGIIVKEMVSGV